jgi:hypothetical protein
VLEKVVAELDSAGASNQGNQVYVCSHFVFGP